ncbi:Cdk5rap1, partial [Symbiodinium sp. KB8]
MASHGAAGGSTRTTIKDFRVVKRLGKGAFGEVYKVQRIEDGEVYALKKVNISRMTHREIQDTLNEIRFLASIRHPNIVNFMEAFVGEASMDIYIVMEFADGGDVAEKVKACVKARQRLDENLVWSYFIQMLEGIAHLHSKQILHRDLKTANMFLTLDGHVKIGDMNVSKLAKQGMAATQIGTPYYMSPEIFRGKAYDAKSDIWSLGCILYELVALQVPFKGRDIDELSRRVQTGYYARLPSTYSADLQSIIRACLKLNPKHRPSAEELLSTPIIAERKAMLRQWMNATLDVAAALETEPGDMLATIAAPRGLAHPSKMRQITESLPAARYDSTRGSKGTGGSTSGSGDGPPPRSRASLPPAEGHARGTRAPGSHGPPARHVGRAVQPQYYAGEAGSLLGLPPVPPLEPLAQPSDPGPSMGTTQAAAVAVGAVPAPEAGRTGVQAAANVQWYQAGSGVAHGRRRAGGAYNPGRMAAHGARALGQDHPVQDLKLEHFIGAARAGVAVEEVASKSAAPLAPSDMSMPSSSGGHLVSEPKSVYLETYGCQMNVSDSEIVLAVLQSAGYERCEEAESADVILTNTCAIRENAEAKIWQRLGAFKNMKARRKKGERPVVGVLGCMAERLKTQLLESDKSVDLVVGPDAYRDLPNLITLVTGGASQEDVEDAVHAGSKRRVSRGAVPAGGGLAAINVQLSADETYADIAPRSRDVSSICREVAQLGEQGYKEVVLLGQNVNSYRDASTPSDAAISGPYAKGGDTDTASGFSNLYNARGGGGVRFTELLERLLQLMNERPNLCKQVHLPAQSGSTSVLRSMRRLYTREAYLELAHRIRETVPGVALSSDFIAGFCGESEADHEDTLSLLEQVGYEQGFLFAYSLRERTHAAHKLEDDVPQDTKLRRLREIIDVFNVRARQRHVAEVGKRVVVL